MAHIFVRIIKWRRTLHHLVSINGERSGCKTTQVKSTTTTRNVKFAQDKMHDGDLQQDTEAPTIHSFAVFLPSQHFWRDVFCCATKGCGASCLVNIILG